MKALLVLAMVTLAAAAPNPFNTDPSLCKKPGTNHTGRWVGGKAARFTPAAANTFQVIDNGVLRVGVVDGGQLNAYPTSFTSADASAMQYPNPVGLRFNIDTPFENDATSPGCLCEGFGASATFSNGTYVEGAGNQASGEVNIQFAAPTSTADSATTLGLIGGVLQVTHAFAPSPLSPNVYQVLITLTNNGTLPITQLQYVRSMDWDIYPSTFHCCVDVNLGTAQDVLCAHDNGFINSLPTANFGGSSSSGGALPIAAGGLAGATCFPGAGQSFSFTGPADHGAAFLIQFHDITAATPLAVGASKSFNMFYGAASDRLTALGVVSTIKAEAYSLGYPSDPNVADFATGLYYTSGVCDPTVTTGAPNTYIWAFSGVGGTPIPLSDPCGSAGACTVNTIDTSCTSGSVSSTGVCATLDFAAGTGHC